TADDLTKRGLLFFLFAEIPCVGRARLARGRRLPLARGGGLCGEPAGGGPQPGSPHGGCCRRPRPLTGPGGRYDRATRRELFRMARVALVMLIVARDTASMSPPTLNGSRMLLPRNCAANSGGSTEKLPYGS